MNFFTKSNTRTILGTPMDGDWLITWSEKSKDIEKILGEEFNATISKGKFTILTTPRGTTVEMMESKDEKFPAAEGNLRV